MWPMWQLNPNPAKFVDSLCNFVRPTLWFPLRRVWGEPEGSMDGGGGCAAVSGGDAWF